MPGFLARNKHWQLGTEFYMVRAMNLIFAIGAGGAIGAVLRHLVGHWARGALGMGFPYGTLTVNIIGSFVMGILIASFALRGELSETMRAFLTVGLLGGFTTFSAFSMEAVLLFERGEGGAAALYVLSSIGLAILGLVAGMWVARTVLS